MKSVPSAPEHQQRGHAPSPRTTDSSAPGHEHPGPPARPGGEKAGAQDRHRGHSVATFRDRFWITLLLTVPTLVWSDMVQGWFRFAAPTFPGSAYIPPIFGTAVYLYGGWVFLAGGLRELRDRLPGMMTLISLAISVAFFFSLAVALGYPGEPLWWELATLVTIMLLGHWIEMRSISQAHGALRELARLLPSTAQRIVGEGIEDVPISALREGDLVLVRPGASVPADGVVRSGKSDVNESMITGESVPVEKTEGGKVIAGTVNGAGSLRVEVTGTGEHTALANIMRLVEQAQTSRSRAQALADRAAFVLTLVAIAAGALTLGVWLAVGASGAFAVERLVAVLVIACPHALGLAVPLVVAISTTIGARSGLLVRDRRGLEEARHLTTVVFDKTGTLTRGEFRVVDTATDGSLNASDALSVAAGVERDSEHTIAQGIVKSAEEQGLMLPKAEQFEAIPGHGVRAVVDGKEFYMGGPAMLRRLSVTPAAAVREAGDRAAARGQAVVYLLTSTSAIAAFAVADAVRPESRDAIRRLHDQRVEVVMLTGDAKAVADAVAADLGIDSVFAEVLPGQKVDKIKELKSQGKRVAMVGDGVNDAPALLTADVAIAIGAGTDVAVEAGDVVLVRSDPRDVPRIIALSRASYRKMLQNLWWAAGYNVFAIPLAAGVLAAQGVLLAPAFAAVLMSASTVIVAVNAQLLRRARL
ncbi:MAG TPA: heavy metal translocating P-type ATPase [Vicinamibacteria bacterium]|nr:heavy metal translocating P-type ATPase [Vicinamibacteria bacterium]